MNSRGNDGDSAGVFEMATGGKGEDVLSADTGADLGTEYVHVGAISTRSSFTATRVSLFYHRFADGRAPGGRDRCVKENESIKSCEQYLHDDNLVWLNVCIVQNDLGHTLVEI